MHLGSIALLYYREKISHFLGVLASLAPTHESEFQISDCNIACFKNLNIFSFYLQLTFTDVQFMGSFLSRAKKVVIR